MAYNPNDVVLLKHLADLASRVKTTTDDLDERIKDLDSALEGLTDAEPNILEGVKVNGFALAIANKMVDILIEEGDTNGTIKVNNTPVSIHGLAALAYKAEISSDELSEALLQTINDKAAASDVTALTNKLNTLIGNETGDASKSAREIASEEVAKIVANADTRYDTLKEIADWILNDTTGAASMANDVQALKNKLVLGTYDDNGTQTEYATVKAYVEAVVSGFISLTALSTEDSGTGNTVTGVNYNSASGKFTIIKGTMVAPVVPATPNSVALLDANGQLKDSGFVIASDADVSAKLDEYFPSKT